MTKNRVCCVFACALMLANGIASAQTFSVLYNFGSKSGDPSRPYQDGIVAQGRDGNLYSTTSTGGANDDGAVFKITPSGALTRLYSFDGTHGLAAFGGLTLGTDGNFYGTTNAGGASSYGTVFKVTPTGKLTVLYSFTNGTDGALPYAPPIQGTDGNFYGTTSQYGSGGYGSVYKITPAGKFTTLYHFDSSHGSAPVAPLVQGTDGNFYGTAAKGGASGVGVVFKITSSGKLTVAYNFDSTHGAYPNSPLIQASDGNFYGTTYEGGSIGSGVVFKITPAGKLTVLHDLTSTTDGGQPTAGLVQATDGNLYSANSVGGTKNLGTVFRIGPKSPYPFKVLHEFDGTTGSTAWATPVQHTNGILYGATEYGGSGNVSPCTTGQCGVLYSVNASLKPFVALLPYAGKVGKTIEFLGQGFTATSNVSFDGVSAAFTVVSDTYLTAIVPSGATTGSVTVTTPAGTLTSNKVFLVTPAILSFSPTSGSVGTQVTINGTSLTGATKVTFGGVKATSFTVDSDTKVSATVPTGAKTGHIAISTPGGTATSSGVFTVTQ